jgi:DNA-directed RNA polymerase subunit K/omega
MIEEEEEEIINFEPNEQEKEINRQRIAQDLLFPGYLTQNELVMVVARRVGLIEAGGPIYIETAETDTCKIALLEIVQGKCPLSIRKSRGTVDGVNIIEIHAVNDMILTKKCISVISDLINLKDKSFDLKEEIKKIVDGDI